METKNSDSRDYGSRVDFMREMAEHAGVSDLTKTPCDPDCSLSARIASAILRTKDLSVNLCAGLATVNIVNIGVSFSPLSGLNGKWQVRGEFYGQGVLSPDELNAVASISSVVTAITGSCPKWRYVILTGSNLVLYQCFSEIQ